MGNILKICTLNPAAYILVIDDDKDLLFIMNWLLVKYGYEVKVLSNCKSTFDILRDRLPDLIILDINLGNCSGNEICREIKSLPQFESIPVILYSSDRFDENTFKRSHADRFIQKPFSNTLIIEAVKEFCAVQQ